MVYEPVSHYSFWSLNKLTFPPYSHCSQVLHWRLRAFFFFPHSILKSMCIEYLIHSAQALLSPLCRTRVKVRPITLCDDNEFYHFSVGCTTVMRSQHFSSGYRFATEIIWSPGVRKLSLSCSSRSFSPSRCTCLESLLLDWSQEGHKLCSLFFFWKGKWR